MKKNSNIEILRAIAIISVVFYHIRCLLNTDIITNYYIKSIIDFGGEIGVTMFFIISGYGMYKSIEHNYPDKINYFEYIRKRFFKIAPAYYFCLLICLFLTGSAVYFNRNGLFDIITHLTFTHNFFLTTHGSINAVLWTMGTFFQFYLIAPLLYRFIKKKKVLGCALIVCLTIISKVMVFYVLNNMKLSPTYFFVYGRQVITALDNFALGMLLACYGSFSLKKKQLNTMAFLGSIVMCILLIYYAHDRGIYLNNFLSYTWHSAFAILLTLAFGFFMNVQVKEKNIINRIILYVGKYEYEIYLWHFVLIANILGTGLVHRLLDVSTILTSLVLLIISIAFGITISKLKKL